MLVFAIGVIGGFSARRSVPHRGVPCVALPVRPCLRLCMVVFVFECLMLRCFRHVI